MSSNLKHFEHFGPPWNRQPVMVFAGQLDTRVHTGEDYDTRTLASLFTLDPSDKPKGGGLAFIPSSYHDHDGREHKAQRERGAYVALTGDVDKGDHPLERIETLVRAFAGDAAWLIYSSAHARPGSRRWRVIMPLEEPVAFDLWHDAQDAFYKFMESAGIKMDWALDRAAQPVYLPNVPAAHEKTGEPLRNDEGEPLYYERVSSGTNAPGLRLDTGALAAGLAAIERQRIADEQERERIRIEAERKRASRRQTDNSAIIDDFNAGTSVETLLELYGYQRSPRHSEDWRSPHQQGETFATRVIGSKWISLSGSDAAAGLGDQHAAGCYGDAYDLFVHFEHGGNHRAAFRTLYAERKAAQAPATAKPGDDPPPHAEDPSAARADPAPPAAEGVSELGFDIRDWSTSQYLGEAPPIEWLCENTIPLGVPALLAAMGGVGKSFLALDLALEIATAVAYGQQRKVLGGNVIASGSVVILNAEDSRNSVHRRLAKIDSGTRREDADGKVFIVPLPEVGGPMPLIAGSPGEFVKTRKFEALLAQLCRIADLRLIIIDPLQAFVTADITKDPAAGQFMWSAFAQVCAATGATVIACHHMRKDGSSRITTAEEARETIRGSTALVDGARATYALWTASEEETFRVCAEAGVDPARRKVVHGAVVKANDEHDLDVHTYLRAETGLLMDATEVGKRATAETTGLTTNQARAALREIHGRWEQGKPFSAAPNSPDRYLGGWLRHMFCISPEAAKRQLDAWFHAGILSVETHDKRNKQKGIQVLKWPG